jgi:hypothetical protein
MKKEKDVQTKHKLENIWTSCETYDSDDSEVKTQHKRNKLVAVVDPLRRPT